MAKTNQISNNLLQEISDALKSVRYGSIEVFVHNKVITQITVRNIHKTSVEIDKEEHLQSDSIEERIHTEKSTVRAR